MQRNCKHCGKEFTVSLEIKKYCSSVCRKKRVLADRLAEYHKDKTLHNHRIRHYRYGLSSAQFEHYKVVQNNKCPICEESLDVGTIAIDHDHSCCSGKKSCGICVRGVIHRRCNTALGFLNDSPERCKRAAEYLERGTEMQVFKVPKSDAENFARQWTQGGLAIPLNDHAIQFATDYANIVLKNFIVLCAQQAQERAQAAAKAIEESEKPKIVIAS